MGDNEATEEFLPPDAAQERVRREYAGLTRIESRHAATAAQRARSTNPNALLPAEAVRLVTGLASGSAVPEADEPELDDNDIAAALTLVPRMRLDVDVLEESLLLVARGRGMTWQQIAYALGLGSAQAARQRYERLTQRAATA